MISAMPNADAVMIAAISRPVKAATGAAAKYDNPPVTGAVTVATPKVTVKTAKPAPLSFATCFDFLILSANSPFTIISSSPSFLALSSSSLVVTVLPYYLSCEC